MTRDEAGSRKTAPDDQSQKGPGVQTARGLALSVSVDMVEQLISVARTSKRGRERIIAATKVLEIAGVLEEDGNRPTIEGARVVVITQGEASRASELLAEERRRALQEG